MSIKDNVFGIYEKAMPNVFDWETKIQVAKLAGYQFIEISIDESDERISRLDWPKEKRDELKSLLEVYDMKIISMCLSGHRRFPFGSANPETVILAKEIMKKAIDLAIDLGISNIQLAGYDVYYEDSTNETVERFISGLKYATELAEKNNIMLSIEIMDTPFIGTITKGLRFVNEVNSKNLQLYPDLGNLSQWASDPENELEIGIDHIVAIHLKDTRPNEFKCVPFGSGTVRFEDLFKKLKRLNYSKPFLIEMWADNDKTYTKEESIKEIEEAKTWLQNRM